MYISNNYVIYNILFCIAAPLPVSTPSSQWLPQLNLEPFALK